MSVFQGNYSFDRDGNLQYNKSGWDTFWSFGDSTPSEDIQRYLLEYNTANKQYEQQYQLQKDSLAMNQQNMQFNQNMANRQQALQEESYYNGVVNQARQLASVGINPAFQGSISSGPSVSGGSSVPGVGSSGSPGAFSKVSQVANRAQLKMQYLAAMMDFVTKKGQLDVAKQNANANMMNAVSNRITADSNANFNSARGDEIRASLDYLREHDMLPPSGAASTDTGFAIDKITGLLNLLLIGYTIYNGKGKNNGNGNNDSGSGSAPTVSEVVEFTATSDVKPGSTKTPLSRQFSDAIHDMSEQEVTQALNMLAGFYGRSPSASFGKSFFVPR